MTDGLVAHYLPGKSPEDLSGHGNHGTLCGEPERITDRAGESAAALDFFFPGDHVRIDDSPSLKLQDQLTLAAWVKTRSLHLGRIVNKWEGGRTTCAYNLGVDSCTQVWTELCGGDRRPGQISVQIDRSFLNHWRHVAGTYDGKQMKLFIDGQLVALTHFTGPLNQDDIPVYLGTGDGEELLFSGAIDDARIYNRALAEEEVAELAGR